MTKKVLKFKKKLVPDTKGTLLSMEVGDSMLISSRDAKISALRTAAGRIHDRKYSITEMGLVNETRVTRLK